VNVDLETDGQRSRTRSAYNSSGTGPGHRRSRDGSGHVRRSGADGPVGGRSRELELAIEGSPMDCAADLPRPTHWRRIPGSGHVCRGLREDHLELYGRVVGRRDRSVPRAGDVRRISGTDGNT